MTDGLFPFPVLTGSSLEDGSIIKVPGKCRGCDRPCEGFGEQRLEACPYGFIVRRVDRDHLIIGLIVSGFNPTNATQKASRAANRDSRVTKGQVDAAVESLNHKIRSAAAVEAASLNAEIESVTTAVSMEDIVKRLASELNQTIGQLHDYRSLALQIRQNVESYLGIESTFPEHLRATLENAPHQLAAAYWASRIVESKLDGVQLLTDLSLVAQSPQTTSRIHGMVHKYRQIFHHACNDKNVSIQLVGESYGKVRGPRLALEQIPLVLIDNAYKYAPAGSNITCGVEESPSTITLTVTSLGPKIEEHERVRIFEPGYRSPHAREREAGMGLGLSLLRLCCETLGADFVVLQKEEPSRPSSFETAFSVTFPKT